MIENTQAKYNLILIWNFNLTWSNFFLAFIVASHGNLPIVWTGVVVFVFPIEQEPWSNQDAVSRVLIKDANITKSKPATFKESNETKKGQILHK